MFENYLLGQNLENISTRTFIPIEDLVAMVVGKESFTQLIQTASVGKYTFLSEENSMLGNHGEIDHLEKIKEIIVKWITVLRSLKDVSVFIDEVYLHHPGEITTERATMLNAIAKRDLLIKSEFLVLPKNDLKQLDNQAKIFGIYTQIKNVQKLHPEYSGSFSLKMNILRDLGIPEMLEKFQELIKVITPNGIVAYFKKQLHHLEPTRDGTFKAKKILTMLRKFHMADDQPFPMEIIADMVEFSQIVEKGFEN